MPVSPAPSTLQDLGPFLDINLQVPHFDVTDRRFGAKGDGVTNDTAAINAAITGCNAAGGGIVLIPAGTYLVNQLTLKANVWVRGAGRTGTTIKLANAQNSSILQALVSNVAISDLKIDGNAAGQSSAGGAGAIRFSGISRGYVRNVHVVNAAESAVYADACTDCVISDSYFETNGSLAGTFTVGMVRVNTGTRVKVINCHVDQPYAHGFQVSGTGCIVSGCTARNPQTAAILFATSSSTDCIISNCYGTSNRTDGNIIDIGDSVNCTIRGNVCVGGRTGIDWDAGTNVDRGNRNTIVGNVCHGNAIFGISAAGANVSGNGMDAVIVGNIVSGSVGGIALDSILNGIVANNLVKNSTGANPGIKFASTNKACTDFTVTGNRCYDDQGTKTQTYGIQSVGTCDFLLVVGNNTRGNLTGGILLVGANNVNANNL
jgi:polygalacturonase